MPGNELGDRVHNFFAQDNLSQGQHHHSQVVEGNWPGVNNNFWAGSQRQIGLLNSSTKNYSVQNSDIDRGQGVQPLQTAHGVNFSQPVQRTDFAKNQSQNDQLNLNGFIFGNQFHQARQNEANFLAVDTDPDQRHIMTSAGLSGHEFQQRSGHGHPPKTSVRSDASISPVSFDLFGGQQQMSHQSNMLQSLQRQQSGVSDMQQLQQQLMIRKMQELQRQQQLQQLDLRQQHFMNQMPPFAKQASGSHSSVINGDPGSDTFHYPWSTDQSNTNWLSRGSPSMQGSPNGLVLAQNPLQSQRFVDMVPQQVDQSLYGVPISSSRDSTPRYSQVATDRPSMFPMGTISNSISGNQYTGLPDQVNVQEGPSVSRQRFHSESVSGHGLSQPLNIKINVDGPQQVDTAQKNAPLQDFRGRQELALSQVTSAEKSQRQVASSQDEVPLDPTEEKILFGSDDNIWAAFGRTSNLNGEADKLSDNGGLSNGFPSLQSGSWSALMQSAVAETSSNDVGPQEEWSGLIFNSTEAPVGNQHLSMHGKSGKHEATLASADIQMPSSSISRSVPYSDNINMNHHRNVPGFNQPKLQSEHGRSLPAEVSQRLGQTLGEASKWSNSGPLQKSVAEGIQIYRNDSEFSMRAETNMKSIPAPFTSKNSEDGQQPNYWNHLAAVTPSRVKMVEEADRSGQYSQSNNRTRVTHDVAHGNILWKSNSGPSPSIDSDHVKFPMDSPQVHKEVLGFNNTVAATSSNTMRGGGETSQLVPINFPLDQWKNVNPFTKPRENESLGRMPHDVNKNNQLLGSMNSYSREEIRKREIENCDLKENSSDSHRSNLSQHASSNIRETFSPDASDSQSHSVGKQKSINQPGRKISGPRRFQYHPMGNLDEDVEPTHSQTLSQHNIPFGQSKFFVQVPKNSMGQSSDLHGGSNGPDEGSSRGNLPGRMINMSPPFSRTSETYTPNKATSSSQNMLELLHKVDQSRDRGATMHVSSSEQNAVSQLPIVENSNSSIGCVQHSQPSAAQGFGLQLGPPSQWMQIPNNSLPYQNARQTISSSQTSHAASEVGEKVQMQMPSTSSVQSLPSPGEKSLVDGKNQKPGIAGEAGIEASSYKMPGFFSSAPFSGLPYSRSHLQSQHTAGAGGPVSMDQNIDSSFIKNASDSMNKGSADTFSPDAACNVTQDSRAVSGGMSQHISSNDKQDKGSVVTISAKDPTAVSRPSGMPSFSQQGASSHILPNIWTNVPTQQPTFVHQLQKASPRMFEIPQPNIVESSESQNQHDHDVTKGGNLPCELGAITASSSGVVCLEGQKLQESPDQQLSSGNSDQNQKMNEPLGNEAAIKSPSNQSPANSASTQKEIEAFGRSLKPHQNYSLLNQMRSMKDAETDSSSRESKRMKGPDVGVGAHQVTAAADQSSEYYPAAGALVGSNSAVSSVDSRMLNFLRPANNLERDRSSSPGNLSSQDKFAFGQNVPQSSSFSDNISSVRVMHPHVSPQMAPSWFSQYGTFKNGQLIPTYNAHKNSLLKTTEVSSSLGKSSDSLHNLNPIQQGPLPTVDTSQVGNVQQCSTPASIAMENFSSSKTLQLNAISQPPRPKKRKSATSELNPWHREVSHGLQKLQTLSLAEIDWAKAAARVTEKIEDDVEFIEDGLPMVRSKRRLILTTQLMQQLLRSPPQAILSADADSNYESVAYSVSRLVLADACNAALHIIHSDTTPLGKHMLSPKDKTTERTSDQHFTKIVEVLTERARKLENDFMRLDKNASVLDLRVECQDLEKFSVINRFAKFHGRGQNENAEAASASTSEVAASSQRPCPQRYVTAVQLPRSIPDRVQCLSL